MAQISIDYGNNPSPFNWGLVDSQSGNNRITLPSEFNEILVKISFVANSSNYAYVFPIPKVALSSAETNFSSGFGFSNQNQYCQIKATTSEVWLSGIAFSTTVTSISSATITVYSR